MANVMYIYSARLGALVAAHISGKKQDATLLLSDLGNKFHEVLQITRLPTVVQRLPEIGELSLFL